MVVNYLGRSTRRDVNCDHPARENLLLVHGDRHHGRHRAVCYQGCRVRIRWGFRGLRQVVAQVVIYRRR